MSLVLGGDDILLFLILLYWFCLTFAVFFAICLLELLLFDLLGVFIDI